MSYLLLAILLLATERTVRCDFSPDTTNYDAYGVKVAGNDIMLVEAQGDSDVFLVQYAPYNYTVSSLQCSIDYNDSTHYVYSVGIGSKQNSTQAYFFFAGEVVSSGQSTTDQNGNNGTFVGIGFNYDSQSAETYAATNQDLPCDQFQLHQLMFISSYGHQEFFVLVVDPYGQYALGFAEDFAFIYRPFAVNAITTMDSNSVWPNNVIFLPHAADAGISYTIVAGYVGNTSDVRMRVVPTVYLISNNNLTILSTWSYSAVNGSWQSRLLYTGVQSWAEKYVMSVDINSADPTRVLIGIPVLNTVFFFVVGNNGTNLTLASSLDNGYSTGFGKSVAWLTTSEAAILVSTYSLDYTTWQSSQINLYTSLNGTSLSSIPTAVVPNSQQPIPSTISSQLIRIISTPTSLAILDVSGNILLMLPASPGFYASTDTTNSPVPTSVIVVSHVAICIAGTYKVDPSIHPCVLCPSGSQNPGRSPTTSCIDCSPDAFCPLGAVVEMNRTLLLTQSQAYAYPRSPESTVFDDILIQNMFSIGSTSHCILVSPLFWTFMIIALTLIILIGMAIVKWVITHPKRHHWLAMLKRIFRQTDLVGEGELWVGGLASFAILVLVISAYTFSSAYVGQYPAEKVGPSIFACDTSLRNSKYDTGLQSLAVPVSDEEQPMFDLLDKQNFTLYVDLLNTMASCPTLTAWQILGSSTTSLFLASCSDTDGTLSASVSLPYQDVTIQFIIADIQVVGAVRLGLEGEGQENGSYELKKLDFRRTFYVESDKTLAQTASISLQLSKAINETESISGLESEFSGLWYPTFVVDENQMFISAVEYSTSTKMTSTTLKIIISETSFFIKNHQLPIAKQSEIIFHNLLFTIVCLEIFGLIFLFYKLALMPLGHVIVRYYNGANRIQPIMKKNDDQQVKKHHEDIELTDYSE